MSNVPVHRTDVAQPALDILDSLHADFGGAETPIKIDCTKFDLSKYSAIRISGYVSIGPAANVRMEVTAGSNNTSMTGWQIKDGTMSKVNTSGGVSLKTDNSYSGGASIDLFIASSLTSTDKRPMLIKFSAASYSGNYRSLYDFTLYHAEPFESLKEISFGSLGRKAGITVYGYRK